RFNVRVPKVQPSRATYATYTLPAGSMEVPARVRIGRVLRAVRIHLEAAVLGEVFLQRRGFVQRGQVLANHRNGPGGSALGVGIVKLELGWLAGIVGRKAVRRCGRRRRDFAVQNLAVDRDPECSLS